MEDEDVLVRYRPSGKSFEEVEELAFLGHDRFLAGAPGNPNSGHRDSVFFNGEGAAKSVARCLSG